MTRQQELKYKRILKRAFKQKPAKPLKSISDDWRTMYKPSDDESYYEVALFEADGLTDEEIEENVESFRIHYVWREYSPTGQWLTQRLSWHRNPCGLVSVIPRIGIDC